MLQAQRVQPVETISWWRVLLVGLLLYFIGIVILVLSGNPVLFPTVLMLGNFVVPITYGAFFYGRRHLSQLSLPTAALSFFYGGVLGVFASALLEPIFVRQVAPTSVFVIGLIEEAAKILGVLLIARRRRYDLELDGIPMTILMHQLGARLSTMTGVALDGERGETAIIYHYLLNRQPINIKTQTYAGIA